ncbi:MAG: LysR family transcriptional regulator [Candidatus Hydrogenedentes bacterium]|nr:LysR family transcriptional regulator [Candidatus Hydrogenedentota bacterium]
MTLESLRCLCAIIETRSFRAAAARLHRSQPAISQALKVLEREAGHALIDRKTGGPTAMGALVYERGRRILEAVDSLAHEVADFESAASRELRVGTSDTIALYVLPPLVREFAALMPETRLSLVNRSSAQIARQVLEGALDLGIVTLPAGEPDLEETPLFRQRIVLVAPRGHALAGRKRVTLKALAGEPLLLLESGTRTGALLERFFAEQDFTPPAVMDSGSFEVIKRYVAEGVGLSFLPEMVVRPGDVELRAIPVAGLPEVTLGAVWRRGAYRSKAQRAFVEMLRGAGTAKGR